MKGFTREHLKQVFIVGDTKNVSAEEASDTEFERWFLTWVQPAKDHNATWSKEKRIYFCDFLVRHGWLVID